MTEKAGANIATLQREWDEALCPICMDHPHNAVLLLCSSHENGCRTYICDTSYRHSNCLDRFKNMRANQRDSSSESLGDIGHQNVGTRHPNPNGLVQRNPRLRIDLNESNSVGSSIELPVGHEENNDNHGYDITFEIEGERSGPGESSYAQNISCLTCPLCRGRVEGWKIIKEARQYLDEKLRACSRESCTFSGNYRELRRHARRVHPTTRPADVNPSRWRAWHRLEHQRERDDILSAIRFAMPGAFVLGDYVIDNGDMFSHDRGGSGLGEAGGSLLSTFLLHMVSSPIRSGDGPRGSSRGLRRQRHHYLWGENLLGLQYEDDDNDDDENLDEAISRPRRRQRFTRSRSEERP